MWEASGSYIGLGVDLGGSLFICSNSLRGTLMFIYRCTYCFTQLRKKYHFLSISELSKGERIVLPSGHPQQQVW